MEETKTYFPTTRYHETEAPQGKRIEDPEEEMALGEGWVDTPKKFAKSAPEDVADAEPLNGSAAADPDAQKKGTAPEAAKKKGKGK